MNKQSNVCNNCSKQGHLFHQCKLPITSYGVIVFRMSVSPEGSERLEYLMIRRKNTFGYIDFIRGKYSPQNILQLVTTIDEMSNEEKQRILTLPFEVLWSEMWGDSADNAQHKNEEMASKRKFELLREGIVVDNVDVGAGEKWDLNRIVKLSTTCWTEPEWEFPKGRRNTREKDLDCALREFEEETGIKQCHIAVIENILPFEELFIGSNHKSYKHKYFVAQLNTSIAENLVLARTDSLSLTKGSTDSLSLTKGSTDSLSLTNYQKTEVSKLEWKTLEECLQSIRPYNLEKKELIVNINKVLQEFRIMSY